MTTHLQRSLSEQLGNPVLLRLHLRYCGIMTAIFPMDLWILLPIDWIISKNDCCHVCILQILNVRHDQLCQASILTDLKALLARSDVSLHYTEGALPLQPCCSDQGMHFKKIARDT